MKREEKIDILVAALAKLIAEGRNDKDEYRSAPQIVFLSEEEVQFEEFPGEQKPTIKVYEDNPLVNILKEVFNYYIDDEKKHYEECLFEEDEQAYEDFENQGIYNQDCLPTHIYHSLRSFGEFIENHEQINQIS
ncbi:hypothetical protein [Bacteroides sp. 51]|uniref:hypothetical protein n=1 Tax=Bacteroides sp. 51 TaxID=2302938 RepID=UPI0013D4C24F|nr:hypothetical protein [Bacteroides sp. 51]NDV80787.1 hypothetical protein [Bacteroides sp. 51]